MEKYTENKKLGKMIAAGRGGVTLCVASILQRVFKNILVALLGNDGKNKQTNKKLDG